MCFNRLTRISFLPHKVVEAPAEPVTRTSAPPSHRERSISDGGLKEAALPSEEAAASEEGGEAEAEEEEEEPEEPEEEEEEDEDDDRNAEEEAAFLEDTPTEDMQTPTLDTQALRRLFPGKRWTNF